MSDSRFFLCPVVSKYQLPIYATQPPGRGGCRCGCRGGECGGWLQAAVVVEASEPVVGAERHDAGDCR